MQTPDHQSLLSSLTTLQPPASAPAPSPEAAVALCIGKDRRGGPNLLLIKRAEHPLDPWSGHIGLPGGRRDATDRDVLHTACRETEEEVGVVLGEGELIGSLPPIQARRKGAVQDLLVHPLVFAVPTLLPTTPSYEVAEARWISFTALTDPANAVRHEVETPSGPHAFPGVHLDGETGPTWLLWGLTYRMISTLLTHTDMTLASGPNPNQ